MTAAADLFYAHGIAATGIDAITEQAGVARKSLYNNFASKDELVLAYLTERHQEWLGLHGCAPPRRGLPAIGCWRCSMPTSTTPKPPTPTGSADADCSTRRPSCLWARPGGRRCAEHKEQVEAILAAVLAEALDADLAADLAEELSFLLEGAVARAGLEGTSDRLVRARAIAAALVDARVGGRGMNRGRMLAIGAITITSILWGTTGTAATFAPDAGPLAIGAAALGIGGILQALIAIPALRAQRGRLRANLPWSALGAVAVAIYPLAFYSSMHLAGVALGTVVSLASAPLASGVLEWFAQRTPLSRWWMLAAGLGIIGSAAAVPVQDDRTAPAMPPRRSPASRSVWSPVPRTPATRGAPDASWTEASGAPPRWGQCSGPAAPCLLPVLLLTGAPLDRQLPGVRRGGLHGTGPDVPGLLALRIRLWPASQPAPQPPSP